MRFLFLFTLVVSFQTVFAQDHGFDFGLVSLEQLKATSYARDSSANAVVLREFGEAYIRPESEVVKRRLIFEHHYLIKILKTDGLNEANITLPLRKNNGRSQQLESFRAASYTLVNDRIEKTEINRKDILTEKKNEDWDEKKISIPNVRVGSIIEVMYTLEDPFYFYNFHTWEFQSHLPKVSSEYWATIPGIYGYNITWRGMLKFSKNEKELITGCFTPGGRAFNCGRHKLAMENIPAFKREAYMTAASNFLSAVYFEISEHYAGDRVDKYTKDWKDADLEILTDNRVGLQLKKGKDIIESIQPELKSITDSLEKAKRIYTFINSWFVWNGYRGLWSGDGIKKAFEKKNASVSDINLSLIAALRAAGLKADLVLLSTRDNGVPTDLHPVITDFNYVVAKINVNNKSYLVDGSDPYLPFGMLPFRCLNGKARVFPEEGPSYWYEILPAEKFKRVTVMNLKLNSDGSLNGKVENAYYGYEAHSKRTDFGSFNNEEEYLTDLKKDMKFVNINSFELSGQDIYEPKFVHTFDVEIETLDQLKDGFMLNPFFSNRLHTNPFKLKERLYPVDFGATQEFTIVLNLTYPENFSIVEKPEKTALTIPGGGGRFLFDIIDTGSKATMTYTLSLSKPIYSSAEYHYIKELFNRAVHVQNFDWLFKKKNP